MWRNYFKTAIRALWRRKSYTLINVFGLSVGMAAAITGYLNWEFNTTWDAFHAKADRIYRIGSVRQVNDQSVRMGSVPAPIENVLRSEIAGVDGVVTLHRSEATARVDDRIFSESLWFSDASLFDVFTLPLKEGSTALFEQRTGVLISEEYATKYFGGASAVGRSIEIRIGSGDWKTLAVSGVLERIPKNSSMQFDVLMHIAELESASQRDPNNWKEWTGAAFVEIRNASALPRLLDRLNQTVAAQQTANSENPVSGYFATPLRAVALESRDIRYNMLVQNPPISSFVGSLVSVTMILLLACFNYINTSITTAASRLKEVGVRKVVGGYRHNILTQFLGEQVLLCGASLLAALGIAELFVRGWNILWSWNPLALTFSDWPLLMFLVLLTFSIAVVAGFYPAWYVSRFSPVAILKGRTLTARINGWMRAMLVLQLGLSLISLIGAVAFTVNARFVGQIDLGYAKDRRFVIPLEDAKLYHPLKNALLADSRVTAVASGSDHLGFGARRLDVQSAQHHAEAATYRVDAGYPSVMGLRLARGRLFAAGLPSDVGHSVVINRQLETALGMQDAVGQTVEFDGARHTVVGVVEDVLNRSVWDPASPVLFKCVEEADADQRVIYMAVQFASADIQDAMNFVVNVWNKMAPDRPFPGQFQGVVVTEAIRVSESITTMMLYMGGLALVIAGLGLFALVSLQAGRRTKEIGVRKVLGATVAHIVSLVNREFLILTLLALVVGDLLGYWMTKSLLDAIYAYHAGVGASALVVANIVTLAIAGTTAIAVVYRAATVNPIRSLRYE